jgi:hypothetical protein
MLQFNWSQLPEQPFSTHIYNKTLIKATDLRNFHITSMWFMQKTLVVIFLFIILIKPNNFAYSAPKFVVLNYYLNQFSWLEIYSKPYYTGWGISRLTPLYPTNGLSYAPGSQYIVVGGKAARNVW